MPFLVAPTSFSHIRILIYAYWDLEHPSALLLLLCISFLLHNTPMCPSAASAYLLYSGNSNHTFSLVYPMLSQQDLILIKILLECQKCSYSQSHTLASCLFSYYSCNLNSTKSHWLIGSQLLLKMMHVAKVACDLPWGSLVLLFLHNNQPVCTCNMPITLFHNPGISTSAFFSKSFGLINSWHSMQSIALDSVPSLLKILLNLLFIRGP